MPFIRGLLLTGVAALLLCGAGLIASVRAQQAAPAGTTPATANPYNLPDTNMGARGTSTRRSAAPPGFAHAAVPVNPQQPDAKPVGQAVCTACHTRESDNFAHTTHGLGMQAALTADPQATTCEACHGGGTVHIVQPVLRGSIIAFTKGGGTPVEAQAAACLGCHAGGPRDHWTGSVHQRNQLSCSDCHNPMGKFAREGLMAKNSINGTCATCHKDIRKQFDRRSHMPLPEGQIACADCHNPHGSANAALLKTDTANETCYGCHAEKRGPFLFEHAPVRDNCLNCHTPHGSNQHALLVTPMPMLCQQCHTHLNHPDDVTTTAGLITGSSPDFRVMSRSCITCHAQVHGSNSPAGPRLHQ